MALEQTSNPLSWYKPLDDIRGNPPETEEERRRRLEQEALQRQMSDLMEEDTEEVQVRKKVEEIKEKREAVDQPEDKEERFVVEEPQEEKSLSWFVPQDKEPQAEEPQTKKPQPKIPEDEVTWDRKVAYGMAQEPTIAGSLWRLGSAKLQSLFDEKTYKEVAREIEYARQERILEMFPEFRGREEDAGVIAGRVGMAIADPVTFLIPWIKIAKLGRMAQLGIGSGIAMGDVSLREEALYGEVDPRIVGLAGVLGAASTGLGIGIQSRFSKGKSDKVDEFVEVIDKQGKKKKVPIKIDETPSGKVPVTTEDINKLNRTGEQVLEETLEEVTGLVKFFDNYGKITHEMNTLLTKVRLVEKNIRTLKKKSKGAFDIRNIPGATFTIQQLRNFKNLQEQVIRVTPRIVKGETKDLMEVPSMFVVRMSPTDYLNLTATKKLQKKLVKDVKGRQTSFEEFLKKTKGLSKQQVKKLQKQSKDAGVWSDWRRWNFNKQASLNFSDSGMSLHINKAGRLFGQEGRHRATLLKMLGAKDMPVILEIGDGGAAALAQTMYNKSGKIATTFKDYGIKQIRGGKYNRKASVNVAKWEIAPLYRGDLEGFRGLNTRGQSYIALTKAYEVAQNVKKVKPTKPQIKAYDAKKALAHAEDEVRVGYAHHKKLLARQTELFTDDIPVNIAAVGWASIKSAWNNGTLTENLARQLQYELVRPLVGGVSGGVFGILTDDDEDNLWTNHLIGSIITGVALGTLQKKIQRSSAELKQPISNKIIRILDKERDKIYRHTNLYMLKSLTAGTHMSWMQASTPINAKLGFKLYRDQGAARAVGKSVANLPVEQADAAVTAVWRRQLYSILKGVEPEDAIAAGRLVNEKGMPATSKHTFLLEGDLENKVATKVADQLEGLRRAYLKYSQEAGVPMNIEDSYGLTQILHPKIASRTDAVRPLIEDAIRIQNANWKDKMRFGKKFAPIEEGNIPQAAAHYIDASTRKRNDSIFIRSNAKLEGRSIFRDRAGDEEEFFTRAAQNLSKDRMIFDPEARAFLMNQGVFVENPRLTFMKLFNYNTRIVEFTRKFGARGEGIQETFKQNRAWFTEQAIKNNMMKKGDRLPASFEASLDKANSRVMDSVDALFGVYGATGSSSDLGRTATLYGQAILATTKLEKVVIPSIGDLAQTIQNSGWGPFVQAEIKQIREKIFRLNDTTRYSKNLGINLYTDDAGFIDKAVGWSRNKRYDDKVVSAELSGFLIEGPNLAPQEWMRRFFEIVQLGRITRHAREVSYDAGVINLYQIGKKLNRRRRNKKGARTVPLSIQKELSDLDVTAKEAMHVARFKSADKAWEDDTIARRIMDRAGLNSADRDALIPTVGNRRLFAQSQDPFIRLLGSFLSWAQAKSTQTNALIARLEHGDNVLAVRMLSVFPVYAGINYLRMSLMSSDKFSEEYTTNPMRYKNLAEIALFKAESAPWYADKMFNSLRHMTGTPTPTVALWPVAGLLNDFTEIVLETAEGEYKEAAVDTFETLIPFGEDLSGLAGWPEDIKKEQEREARRKDREKRLPSRRRPDYFEGGKVSPDYAVSNVVEDPSERGNARTGLPFDEPFERNGMKGGGVMVSVGIAPVSEKQISKLQKVLKERKAKREGGEVRQQYGIGRLVKALIRNRENVKKLREKPVEKPVEKIVEKPVEKVAEVEKTEAIAKVKEGLEWEQHVDNHIEGDEDRRLARAIVMAESSGDPTKVNAKSGAVGLMQILPSTAGQPGYGVKPFEGDDLAEQKKNIEFGWNYFTGMRNHFGNDRDAHIAYNWGPGNTEEWLSTGGNLENIPEETRDYLGKISNYGK